MPTLINPYAFRPGTMLSAIQRLGLTSGLKLCLDAGDINSVAVGSQTKWLDVSGNGYDFFRGTDATSQATDPTFNGTPGSQTSAEYWGFDGGDYFSYDTANEPWMQNLHKDGAQFTVCGWAYVASGASALFGDVDTNPANGCTGIGTTAGGKLELDVLNASGHAREVVSSASFPTSQWVFWATIVDEAAGTGTQQINGTQEAFTSTYVSPLSTNSTSPMQIGADGRGQQPLGSGSRVRTLAAWEGVARSAAELLALFEATRATYGV